MRLYAVLWLLVLAVVVLSVYVIVSVLSVVVVADIMVMMYAFFQAAYFSVRFIISFYPVMAKWLAYTLFTLQVQCHLVLI